MVKRWLVLPRGIRWTIGGIAAVVLGLAVAWTVFVPVADWLAHHDVGPVMGSLHETAVDNARGLLLTLGAGLVAAGALAFTALNFNLLRRNSEQADQWQRRTHELTEQGQVTDRYTKAVEQLGSDKLAVRIGGIYALERVARDSAKDHPTVMEVLTAFIREQPGEQRPLTDPDSGQRGRWTPADVQAAVTVVGRREVANDSTSRAIDLAGANLAGADLSGAKLRFANLRSVNLAGANLVGADLCAAMLADADLTDANPISADLERATLTDANLTGANLMGANLRAARCNGANLTGANLHAANLKATLINRAILANANLDSAEWRAHDPVPGGWRLDTDSGRLQRANTGSGVRP
ncbi:MAG TPA: pentapeptide repeat-containing protein [Streptosporangiaceae bacterium]|nr:pentapeptide repeat-containing protein [Streptosporangiaceae bacterium]